MMTRNELEEQYLNCVLQKAAPYRHLSQDNFDLLHCGIGLTTELLELQLSSPYSADHDKEEELGDMLWYLTLASAILKVHLPHIDPIVQVSRLKLIDKAERFASLIKRHTIYGVPQNLVEPFLDLWRTFNDTIHSEGYTLDQLRTSNIEKLNKRYKASFTPEESQERNDKK